MHLSATPKPNSIHLIFNLVLCRVKTFVSESLPSSEFIVILFLFCWRGDKWFVVILGSLCNEVWKESSVNLIRLLCDHIVMICVISLRRE